MDSGFRRYLEAKRTVDDRALNRLVLERFRKELSAVDHPPRILEIGAGVGIMLERLVEWGVLAKAEYTLLDEQADLLMHAANRLKIWAASRGWVTHQERNGTLRIEGDGVALTIVLEARELSQFTASSVLSSYDALIACAVLDLVDVPSTLPKLWSALKPSGLFWFCINFDGETVFCPEHELDDLVYRLYHAGMDTRVRNGVLVGHSKTGRRLFADLTRSGARVLASGSSDWVVFADSQGYPGEEAAFLHHILNTVEDALGGHPELDAALFGGWIERRRAQVESRELVYIAHQLDFVGRREPVNVR